ncbi:exodeoxyribonuclease III [Roseivirga pacifica]|uniref:exodeoxyribonuclease III n=1 Tax=Roseivirga pacifica TaxID=1267423 RepID=UPI00209459B0|nr:exodeoxyribonuclease III [Roseivirga pacifica]MCO6359263.1 exodeoxyribonuclease III [Roseivirga pacifica]MCO6365101.1 exodeoxyribonuclease III [Roseivirga pacifica]MCO6372169.1 exodeoxyribonuclease III [Roseivirga pacifica]MCO6375720.1 exodeoxyribonuclease III [Roseivirga pacifica]MCO6379547.1 exodeoxyribonuclease III [Roseivirga pacifica]
MKIISYNVNGIRAALKKGFEEWLTEENPDILCLQELKALPEQVPDFYTELGYEMYWESAEKKGYSGVAILTKKSPKQVVNGCGNELYDNEGRVIRCDYEDFSVMSVYMPSGTSGDIRQDFKYEWLDFFYDYALEVRKEQPNLIICGDYNIAHTEIDIHNPVSNKNSSGFLPEEREWLTKYVASGFIDTFREFNPDPHHYSWWSYRANARANNKGWRIDYLMATEQMKNRLSAGRILPDVKHSDHCPIVLEID